MTASTCAACGQQSSASQRQHEPEDAPGAAARALSRVAWPALAVLLLTDIWNIAATGDDGDDEQPVVLEEDAGPKALQDNGQTALRRLNLTLPAPGTVLCEIRPRRSRAGPPTHLRVHSEVESAPGDALPRDDHRSDAIRPTSVTARRATS